MFHQTVRVYSTAMGSGVQTTCLMIDEGGMSRNGWHMR